MTIAIADRGTKLLHLAVALLNGCHRTSLGFFLRRKTLNLPGLLNERAMETIRSMRPRKGESIELLIDDNRVTKRGKKMACLQKIYDHARGIFAPGHIWVVAAIRFRGVVLPWRIDLWKPKTHCKDAGQSFRKSTFIAAEMIRAFEAPAGLKIRVLFDAFYLCPAVTKACETRGFTWFSVAKRNRKFRREGVRGGKVGSMAVGWVRHEGKTVLMPRSRGRRKLRVAWADGHLKGIGPVRLVASRRPGDPWKNLVVFATNEVNLQPREIVSIYERRWDIEVMFKELRTALGWGDYQMLDEQAIVNHQHLCALAHQLLTHHAMEGIGAKARKPNQEAPLPTLSIRRDNLRQAVRRDQVRRLFKGAKHEKLRRKLEPYLNPG